MPSLDEQVRALQIALEAVWQPGDLKLSEVAHPDALTNALVEAQPGWLIANGATITSAVYPALFTLVGATLPDYRDRFIAAPGTNNGQRITGGALTASFTLSQANLPSYTLPNTLAVGVGTLGVSGGSVVSGSATVEVQSGTGAGGVYNSISFASPGVSGAPSLSGSVTSGGSGTSKSVSTVPPFRSCGVVLVHV